MHRALRGTGPLLALLFSPGKIAPAKLLEHERFGTGCGAIAACRSRRRSRAPAVCRSICVRAKY